MADEKIKVLLVDDHVVVRNGLSLMLGSSPDIEVAGEASTADEARTMVQANEYDVVLMDIGLPDKNGLELLKLVKADKPTLAVLMFSMYAEEIYAVRALKLGAAGYLTKNSPVDVVLAAVRKAASGGKYVSPALTEQLAGMVGRPHMQSHHALSNRELEVLRLIAGGESLISIGQRLHLSPSTVTTYRSRILEKMGLGSNAELARYALENGLLV
ncbi:MAG: response regulator transcription factor [Gammaproteobacteria bacterium]|jgi:DNA-binding NarL/FixJ family response regulator|nr:response regulator transcription factor [Gammaproteobacteria bacterium]MBU0786043.1 response regulator transcription factor [Gammaproteobacteria bacterium]MBU0814368.1 response regulator transcription factor [Gammaproteobacteria bacterium]MBU1786787.1 response regulator transcription factor [Gammaproteobacteria bacterium]